MREDRMIMVVRFSDNIIGSFDVDVNAQPDLATYIFTRMENGAPNGKMGTLTIHDRTHTAEFRYDFLTLRGSVIEQKKMIDNYYFKCVGDMFCFRAYICHRNLWLKCGAGMFNLDEQAILDSVEGHCRQ